MGMCMHGYIYTYINRYKRSICSMWCVYVYIHTGTHWYTGVHNPQLLALIGAICVRKASNHALYKFVYICTQYIC